MSGGPSALEQELLLMSQEDTLNGPQALLRLCELFDLGVNLEVRCGLGRTAFHHASTLVGAIIACELMLNVGARIDTQDARGRTPLHEVVRRKSVIHCRTYLDRGANAMALDHSGRAPLHEAAAHGGWECCQLLVERGVPVDSQTAGGQTALGLAAENGREYTFLVLLACGAHPQAVQQPVEPNEEFLRLMAAPMHLAAERGCALACARLLEQGWPFDALDTQGHTALELARCHCNDEVLDVLRVWHARHEARQALWEAAKPRQSAP